MATELDRDFCRLCLKTGVLTKEQIQSAVKVQSQSPGKTIPQILVDLGILEAERANELVRHVLEGEQQTIAIPNTDPLVGKMLGKCVIQQMIGRGGMGTVYKGLHKTLNCPVAVKVLPPQLESMDPSYVHRFVREARVAVQINHHNIVRVMDVGKNAELGRYYIIMEFVDGTSVGKRLRKQGRLQWQKAFKIITSVAEALREAAKLEIIHRDIKPDNIMLTADGEPKLADLGLAKRAGTNEMGLTLSGIAIGTPYYMSPEQARDARSCDCRSDIYSLGATFYHMVTGKVPFAGQSAYEVLSKHEHDPLPEPQLVVPDLPEFVPRIIGKMMAKNPDHRYQSVDELLKDLQSCTLEGANGGISSAEVAEAQSLQEDVLRALAGFRPEDTAKRKPSHVWNAVIEGLVYCLVAGAILGIASLWEPLVARVRAADGGARPSPDTPAPKEQPKATGKAETPAKATPGPAKAPTEGHKAPAETAPDPKPASAGTPKEAPAAPADTEKPSEDKAAAPATEPREN